MFSVSKDLWWYQKKLKMNFLWVENFAGLPSNLMISKRTVQKKWLFFSLNTNLPLTFGIFFRLQFSRLNVGVTSVGSTVEKSQSTSYEEQVVRLLVIAVFVTYAAPSKFAWGRPPTREGAFQTGPQKKKWNKFLGPRFTPLNQWNPCIFGHLQGLCITPSITNRGPSCCAVSFFLGAIRRLAFIKSYCQNHQTPNKVNKPQYHQVERRWITGIVLLSPQPIFMFSSFCHRQNGHPTSRIIPVSKCLGSPPFISQNKAIWKNNATQRNC